MVTIPLKVSEELAGRLLPLQDRLPEIVELGLHQIRAGGNTETSSAVSKVRVLTALDSTGIVTLPKHIVRLQPRIRRTPIRASGPLASEIIIQDRGLL